MEEVVLDDSPVVVGSRRRVRPATIDLTGDGSPLERPVQRRRAVIDLTGDDEDDVVVVGEPRWRRLPQPLLRAPPPRPLPPPPPQPRQPAQALQSAVVALRLQIDALERMRRTIAMPQAEAPRRTRVRKVKMSAVERKPLEGNMCPICYEEFGSVRKNSVHCRFGCGGNVHAACMERWKRDRNKEINRGPLTCILCRAPWNGMKDEPV